jgi:AcrR family transcriptional regulator
MGDRSTERSPLTRARVLDAAVALADEGGLSAVTMRRLGEAVGVEAMSLYHHVANKDEVVDGMVDRVFAEIDLPVAGEPWRPAMARRARSARAALVRHRWAIGVLESRTSPGPDTLRHHEAVLGCLRAEGFDFALVGHAVAALDSYVYGFALQEATLPFEGTAETHDVVAEMMPLLAEGHPHLAEMASEHVMAPGYDFGDEFDWGLEVILDGIERAHEG